MEREQATFNMMKKKYLFEPVYASLWGGRTENERTPTLHNGRYNGPSILCLRFSVYVHLFLL
jgi:hypothetical protein